MMPDPEEVFSDEPIRTGFRKPEPVPLRCICGHVVEESMGVDINGTGPATVIHDGVACPMADAWVSKP